MFPKDNIIKDVYKSVKVLGCGAINIVDLTTGNSITSSSITVLAFPPAGGVASIYASLSQHLKCCRLLAVDLPGHLLTAGDLFNDYESLCDFLFANLPEEIMNIKNLVLMGTSLGGYLICGLAKRLIQLRSYYPKLIMLSTPPPCTTLHMLPDFESLPTEVFFDKLIESKETISEIMSNNVFKLRFDEILRADLRVFHSFSFPKEIESCHTLLIGGLKDHLIDSRNFFLWSNYFENFSVDFVNHGHLFVHNMCAKDIEKILSEHSFLDFNDNG